jgi:serine/threonine protein kinase
MERMDKLLFDALPELLSSGGKNQTRTIALGPIIDALVTIFEAIHKTGHLILDVKPDNIMVATTMDARQQQQQQQQPVSPSERLAARIRLVDFGLVKTFMGANGHKENVPSADIQGTPLYASLHQHAHQAASRRDDMEALLYVIGDLFLTLQGLAQKTQPPYGRGDRASFLPWSEEMSDAALGAKKKTIVENKKSVYYKSMPTKVASALFAATQMVQKCEYSQKPRYNELKQCLAAIELELPASSGTPAKQRRKSAKDAATTPSTETPTALRRSPRRPLSMVDDQSLRSIKASPAKRTRKVELVEVDEDNDVIMQDVDDDVDNRKPAAKRTAKPRGVKRSSPEEQATDVEDLDMAEAIVAQPRTRKAKGKAVAAATVAASVPSKPATRLAALIKVTDGKHAGEQHWLASGACERLVVGSAPTGAGSHMTIAGDSRIAPNHMTLDLIVFEGPDKSVGVKVTDLKSTDGVLFNGKRIASGKSEMAFCDSASLGIGSHIIKVCRE